MNGRVRQDPGPGTRDWRGTVVDGREEALRPHQFAIGFVQLHRDRARLSVADIASV